MSRLSDLANRLLYPTSPAPASTTVVPSPPRDGIYLGYGTGGPVIAGPEHHALVLGPPRSGKTTRLVVPSVIRHRGPVVVTSTKPDIIWATHQARSAIGNCWYWDPSGTTVVPAGLEPLGWSPIVGCETWDHAVARAHALATAARPNPTAHEVHWVERAQAMLAPLLHAAAISESDLAVLLSWVHRRELTVPKSLLESAEARRAADLLEGLAHTDLRELSGIFSTADSLLGAYRSDAALNAARRPTFDPELFASSTDTVYLVSPAATQAIHSPIVVALLDQIRAAVYRWHPRPSMLFALDELANIAPLPDLPATLAEGGSQGLTVIACLQDLSQARSRWDKAADGFLTLFTHKIVLPGIADLTTLKAISALAGEVDVPMRSTSRSGWPHPGTTTTWSTRRQPTLPLDAIASGTPGSALLLWGAAIYRIAV